MFLTTQVIVCVCWIKRLVTYLPGGETSWRGGETSIKYTISAANHRSGDLFMKGRKCLSQCDRHLRPFMNRAQVHTSSADQHTVGVPPEQCDSVMFSIRVWSDPTSDSEKHGSAEWWVTLVAKCDPTLIVSSDLDKKEEAVWISLYGLWSGFGHQVMWSPTRHHHNHLPDDVRRWIRRRKVVFVCMNSIILCVTIRPHERLHRDPC